ncbi:unnamed protein product [Rotaria magnacalcarata]|uniref:Uncharacterized protein n=1 Tax=Rotaria magnacalcarata TaxID=392030 RepID=A0A820NA98_9BILA|nr:unnamed protein product [Rotaria magnacalcarata]
MDQEIVDDIVRFGLLISSLLYTQSASFLHDRVPDVEGDIQKDQMWALGSLKVLHVLHLHLAASLRLISYIKMTPYSRAERNNSILVLDVRIWF